MKIRTHNLQTHIFLPGHYLPSLPYLPYMVRPQGLKNRVTLMAVDFIPFKIIWPWGSKNVSRSRQPMGYSGNISNHVFNSRLGDPMLCGGAAPGGAVITCYKYNSSATSWDKVIFFCPKVLGCYCTVHVFTNARLTKRIKFWVLKSVL